MTEALGAIGWHSDEYGDYWHAPLLRDGKQIGIIGSYYDLDESGKRWTRAEQEHEIASRWEDHEDTAQVR